MCRPKIFKSQVASFEHFQLDVFLVSSSAGAGHYSDGVLHMGRCLRPGGPRGACNVQPPLPDTFGECEQGARVLDVEMGALGRTVAMEIDTTVRRVEDGASGIQIPQAELFRTLPDSVVVSGLLFSLVALALGLCCACAVAVTHP